MEKSVENGSNSGETETPPSESLAVSDQNQLSVKERFEMIRSIGPECTEEDELERLLANKPQPIFYDGFEPSARMDIAQGVMKAINVNKLTSAGCKVKIWIADWFALLNNKMEMGGDLEDFKVIGEYLIEVWKAVGMNTEGGQVEFLWSSEEIDKRPEYWHRVMDIAIRNNLKRCCQIMGCTEQDESSRTEQDEQDESSRTEQDELSGAQILYPFMQCADIFLLEADICHMVFDHSEMNALAREYCDIERKNKPIILSHHMLPGLQEGQEKMSKSHPSSSIYMEDEEADVNLKIKKAFCPPKIVEKNPCLEYIKYIILPWFNEFTIERKPENGGDKTFKSFKDLTDDYESGELHPGDLKPALAKAINRILQSVRDHFNNDPKAKELLKRVKELLKRVKKGRKQIAKQSPLPRSSKTFSRKIDGERQQQRETETPLSESLESLSISDQNQLMKERFEIIRSIGEECVEEDELERLLANKPQPICYDGFEPSGRMHIAQGVMKAINVNKLTSAGCKVKIWIADWFAQLNNKMGGDLEKIKVIGEYLIEIWKAVGMNTEGGQVEFLWSSEEIDKRPEYWHRVMDIAIRNNLKRLVRCCQIMGRTEKDELSGAQILYPIMQCADIFFLEADICQLGMDQRKVNMLAREYCNRIKRKNKPIILSHHMLPGLQEGQEKMSKSDPSSSIYMEDEEADVNLKIENAFCPPKIVEKNPCLEYIKYIILPWFNEFTIERKPENGGDKTFKSFKDLTDDYESGELHPGDLKLALAKAINRILQPVRDHFNNDPKAKELLKRVKSYRVTR